MEDGALLGQREREMYELCSKADACRSLNRPRFGHIRE